jgi:hypothetical protein
MQGFVNTVYLEGSLLVLCGVEGRANAFGPGEINKPEHAIGARDFNNTMRSA